MSKHLVIDAWIREAQEAEKLVEDIETRVKNKDLKLQHLQPNRFSCDIAKSKLMEVGVKLDRLEALLRNPPSKPILTNEDLGYRWKTLSDMQLRTKSLAVSLYAVSSSNRSEGLADTKEMEMDKEYNIYDHDQSKASFAKSEPQLLKPLISDDTPPSHMQTSDCSSFNLSPLFWKVCLMICLIFGVAALLFVLFILCGVL